MNNNKKSHKLKNSSLPPPTKIKIITNGNGMTAVPVNGKMRGRPSKHNATATDALDVFTFVCGHLSLSFLKYPVHFHMKFKFQFILVATKRNEIQ